MRPDQIQSLNAIAEKLADVFITEADPDNWSAGGVIPRDMTPQQRGDRHWDRKGAMGTGGVLRYTLDVLANALDPAKAGGGEEREAQREADLDKVIRDAQRKAAAAVDRVINKAKGKDEFDKRAHGTRR